MEKLTKSMRVTCKEQDYLILLRKWGFDLTYLAAVIEEHLTEKKRVAKEEWEKLEERIGK